MAESPTKKQETTDPTPTKESPQNEEAVVAKPEADKPAENGDKPQTELQTEEAVKSAEAVNLTEVCAPAKEVGNCSVWQCRPDLSALSNKCPYLPVLTIHFRKRNHRYQIS